MRPAPAAHGRRTAERWAGFLLPHLRPGMRLLDLGCGPGSITAGLAAGRRAVGVDVAPTAIEAAPVAAADTATLPFPDACFGALYANAAAAARGRPLAVLRERRHVARPGAVIGVGDADWGGVLMHPPIHASTMTRPSGRPCDPAARSGSGAGCGAC